MLCRSVFPVDGNWVQMSGVIFLHSLGAGRQKLYHAEEKEIHINLQY